MIRTKQITVVCASVALLINGSHGGQDMDMGVIAVIVMIGQINTHALGDELLLAVLADEFQIVLIGQFTRQRHDKASGILGITLGLIHFS